MLAAGVSAAEIFLTAAVAAVGTATSCAPSAEAPATTWRTGNRQPYVIERADREFLFHLAIARAASKGGRSKPVYSHTQDGYNHRGWATREAAEAAKPAFKAWAESGTRTALHAARTPSAVTPAAPTRHSRRVNVVCACCRTLVCALATGAAANSTIEWVPMNTAEADVAWRERSEHMLKFTAQARRWRQQRAVAEARACVSDGEWEQFLERCRKVAAADEASGLVTFRSKRHRGKGRARLISQRSQAHPDRHVQRREHRLTQQVCSVQYAAQHSTV